MLEKIGQPYYEKLSTENKDVIAYLKEIQERKQGLAVAEIGVGIGATSKAMYELLSPEDDLFLADYEEKVQVLQRELEQLPYDGPQITALGNSPKLLDSYAWTFAEALCKGRQFDLIFLDGAHNFVFDGLICAMASRMLKKDGYLLVDDVDFTMRELIEHNPRKREQIEKMYTTKQQNSAQLTLALRCFIEDAEEFQEMPFSGGRAFQKKGLNR